jgi:hypothetical protein
VFFAPLCDLKQKTQATSSRDDFVSAPPRANPRQGWQGQGVVEIWKWKKPRVAQAAFSRHSSIAIFVFLFSAGGTRMKKERSKMSKHSQCREMSACARVAKKPFLQFSKVFFCNPLALGFFLP